MNDANCIVVKVTHLHFICLEIKCLMELHVINQVMIFVLMEFVIKFIIIVSIKINF